ncbi:MAG: oxidase [Flavobacterium sp.]|uniref:oxidase n=1 Tax=Flavobacterium sp. TaxID=239 RepID=UPI002735F748|nr:oxidase [Flavobacterium sp.]MDP3679778.1 oxidase [Flavobacterium sp.]MDZ4331620.1 oxidase [Flavobacterium sp.]
MTDFLLADDGDMTIANGDFLIGDSEAQDVELLITSSKGAWKEHPLIGVGIAQLVKTRATEVRIKRDINEQLMLDGFINIDIDIDYPDVHVDANR